MPVDSALSTFVTWHRIILAYALLMGIEGPGLLLVARCRGRPWREQLVVALPVGAFVWMMAAARQVRAAHDAWGSYIQFQDWHYPPTFVEYSAADAATAAARVPRLGWTVFAVAAALVLLGWLLLVLWDPRTQPAAKPAAGVAPPEAAPVPLHSATAAGPVDGDEFEMRVEPIEPGT